MSRQFFGRKAFSAMAALLCAHVATADITGVVYQDYNSNGVRDTTTTIANAGSGNGTIGAAVDQLLANVTVTVTCVTGNGFDGTYGTADDVRSTFSSVVTNGTGPYTVATPGALAGTVANPSCRVTFSWDSISTLVSGVPNPLYGMFPSFNANTGTNPNNTSTQFVGPNGVADLGLNYPADFCQNNPMLVTVCGTYAASAGNTISHMRAFPYSARSNPVGTDTPAFTSYATGAEIGSTWGVAQHKTTGKILASAYFKRHVGVGSGGVGQIYAVNAGGGGATPFVNLETLVPGSTGIDPRASLPLPVDFERDLAVLDGSNRVLVGKLGIGDIDLSDDQTTLYAIGLNSKALYRMTVGAALTAPTSAITITLPTVADASIGTGTTGCPTDGDLRPFGIKYHKGFLYVALTCTAESTITDTATNAANPGGDPTRLRAFIYRMNPSTNAFTQVSNFSLNVTARANPDFTAWHNSDASDQRPEPLVTDIEFVGNDMVIGVRDRFGDNTGRGTLRFNGTGRADGRGHGDMFRACPNVSGVYDPANCATSGFTFYQDDQVDQNSNMGGLAQVPGFPDMVYTKKDPVRIWSSGIGWNSNGTGAYTKGYELLFSNPGPLNGSVYINGGKSSTFGDIEALCNSAPIQVGNRVWIDSNGNGIQDAGEPPAVGVTVRLYAPGASATDPALAVAQTDQNGNYYFSNRQLDENGVAIVNPAPAPGNTITSSVFSLSALTPSTTGFQIRFDENANYIGGPLNGLRATIPNASGDTTNDPLADLTDSDATAPSGTYSSGNYPAITFNTGAPGENNFGLDAGFNALFSLGNRVWGDTNNDGVLNGSEAPIAAVLVRLTNSNGDPLYYTPGGALSTTAAGNQIAQLVTDANGHYRFDNLPAGDYRVVVDPLNWSGGLTGTFPSGASSSGNTVSLTNVTSLSGYASSSGVTGTTSGSASTNNNDKGIDPATAADYVASGVRSGVVTLGVGNQPASDADAPPLVSGGNGPRGDASDNLTLDFGFYRLSVGDTLWFDNGAGSNKNNGIKDAAEGALPAGVVVELLKGGVVVASTTTDANGNYVFTAQNNAGTSTGTNGAPLAAGADYTVRVPAGQAPLNGSFSSTNPAAQTPTSPGVGTNDDGDSGTGVANAFATATVTVNFTLGVSASGTATPDVNGIYPVAQSGANNGTNHRPNVDLGFTTPFFAIGNRVWYDTNNNGILDAGEQPIAGVKVILLDSSSNPLLGQTLITDANGYYRFDGLVAGTYTVLVAPDNWTGLSGQALLGTSGGAAVTPSGAPLAGYSSSTAVTGVTSGAGSTNNNDKGIDPANAATYTNPAIATGGVRSGPVTVGPTLQPTSDLDNATPFSPTDASTVSIDGNGNDNLAVDFGFFRLNVGNLIWNDGVGSGGTPNDGIRNGTEPGIAGVAVQLVNSGGTVVAQAVTDANGNYSFTQLTSVPGVVGGVGAPGVANGQPILPGNYTVRVPGGQNVLAGATSSADPAGGGQPIGDSRDNGTGAALATGDTNSPAIALTATTASLPGGATQTNATGVTVQPRMDFAFVVPIYAIGNRIWFDTNNNGVKDAGEAATPGVLVELVNSANAVVATTATNAAGEYIFDNLPAGTYTVRVASTNWAVGGITSAQATAAGNAALAGTRPLQGYANSTAANPIPGTGAIGTADGTDKGINSTTPATSGISSPPVTVGPGPSPTPQLPTGESAAGDNDAATTTAAGDANDNMAVDFGFYRLTAGNQIWFETNGNSTYTSGTDATPPSVQGITVELRDASTNAVIATTTTDASGNYQFVSLSNGNPIPAGAYYVSLPTLPAGTQPIPVGTALTDNNNQGATPVAPIAGVAVRTGTFNLAPGVTTENQTVTSATGTTAQPTLDIGFQAVYSLGNRVWVDANNNGTVDPTESGLDGVIVNLRDGSGAQLYRTPTGAITTVAAGNTAISTTTTSGGHYLFTNLPAGSYTVEIVTPTAGANSYVSSTGVNGGVTGPFEPIGAAAFGNTATNFDHGIQFAPNTIRSRPITLGPGQPTTEDGNTTPGQTDTTPDNQSNLTVDFGVFIPAELGNFVWQDIDRDGTADPGEPGINGVTVTLRDPLTNAVIATLTTIDRPAGETSGQPGPGWYQFTNLIPGNYVIEFSAPGYSSTASGTPAGTSGTQPETNNNQLPPGVSTGRTATVSVSAGDNNPQLDAGFMPDPIAVPMLSQWLQVMLALVMFGAAAHTLRRRARATAWRA
jgi:SdrD B-like domain